jgi:8-oxo-dGTP pyrophosphatase MutT (NUDIX family)
MIFSHQTRAHVAERLRRLIGGLPCRTQVAALPFRQSDAGYEVMLITSRGTGRWVIPKGWPEGEEALWHAAAREADEEAGVAGEIAQDALGRFYYAKQLARGRQWRCEVLVYPLEVKDVADKWREKKKRRRRWFPVQDAARLVNEPDLAELIARFGAHPRKSAA